MRPEGSNHDGNSKSTQQKQLVAFINTDASELRVQNSERAHI